MTISEVKYKESSHDIRGLTKVNRITAVEPNISTNVNITDGKSSGFASSRIARTASMTRRTLDWLERVAVEGGTEIPRASISSFGPIIEVQSPLKTCRSRPGHGTTSPGVGEFLPWTTATGARSL